MSLPADDGRLPDYAGRTALFAAGSDCTGLRGPDPFEEFDPDATPVEARPMSGGPG